MRTLEDINQEAYNYAVSVGQNFDPVYEPIKTYLNADAFAYFKYRDDGSFLFLGSGSKEAKWLQKWYFLSGHNPDKGSKSYFDFVRKLPVNSSSFHCYPRAQTQNTDTVLNLFQSHGVKTIWSFCTKHVDYVEDFRFVFTDYQSTGLLIQRASIFLTLIKYLKEQYKDIFHSNEHIVGKYGNKLTFNLFKESNDTNNSNAFLKFLEQNDLALKSLKPLSPQEYQCLKLLIGGNNAKDTGLILNISPRTVETYINNVKAKTGCYFKSKLIDKFFYHFYDNKYH